MEIVVEGVGSPKGIGAPAVPLTERDDKIGLPRNADMGHPRLSQLAGHTVLTYPATPPEAEGLMEQKGR